MANAFEIFMNVAGKIPAVRISREDFLRTTFKGKTSKSTVLEQIVEKGPLAAGVAKDKVDKIADSVISTTATSATGASVITGLPGGIAMFATIPADVTQLYIHIFIVTQKLLYLYGWQEDVFDEAGNIDDETKNYIILTVGLMSGVGAAAKPLANIAAKATKRVIDKAVLKTLSPKLIWIILTKIGVKTTVKSVWKYATKTIPVVSGVISGAITLATFLPMANKLKNYLSNGVIDINDTDSSIDNIAFAENVDE